MVLCSDEKSPIRSLHVVGGMNQGGVETWLMHVLRHIDRDQFPMDFLVHTTSECAYDEEIRALGSGIIPCLSPRRPVQYARNFLRILRQQGPYDIVHSHVHHYSGFVLRLAHQADVPVRIAHSHTSLIEARTHLPRRLYLGLMKRWITRYATVGLACSRKAAMALFGTNWETDRRWQVLYYGIDLEPFEQKVDSQELRRELSIPADAFVVGHVGRFAEPKNHTFLIDVFAEVVKREPRAWLLLVGDGPLRPSIEQKVHNIGLAGRVIFAGVREDVPRLMRGGMDVFLFPSLYEGLGLVLIEAQAARLPCVFSDVVPEEADVVEPLLRRLSLSQTPSDWAEAVLSSSQATSSLTPTEALALVQQSPFNVQASVAKLEEVYCG